MFSEDMACERDAMKSHDEVNEEREREGSDKVENNARARRE